MSIKGRASLSAQKPQYVNRLQQIHGMDSREQEALQEVVDKFVFRSNEYYNSLIDWHDPADPIRRIIIPDMGELDEFGTLDASNESDYTVVPGCEHKYRDTALLLVNDVCGGYCRFCFRKRLFMDDNDEVVRDIDEGLAYIREHQEIDNVLLTGGDPLILGTRRLEPVLRRIREIEHVRIIRIGSKMPAFNPFRILEDESLLELFARYSTPRKRIYLMAHFNHPRELTPEAMECMAMLQRVGVATVNQSPLLAGVNDDPRTLSELFDKLSFMGVAPYYMFQCRPTEGNRFFTLGVEEASRIFEEARLRSSGLAKRARLVMSHASGKIEILGTHAGQTFFRYQRAADPEDEGRFLIFPSNPEATWFDDYVDAQETTTT